MKGQLSSECSGIPLVGSHPPSLMGAGLPVGDDLAVHDDVHPGTPAFLNLVKRLFRILAFWLAVLAALPKPAFGGELDPPAYIRVYRAASGTIETVPLDQYIADVLVNEWAPFYGFGTEALKAGAMAVKAYIWYLTKYPKYPGKGYDVKDSTADQVYIPGSSNAYPAYKSAVQAVSNVGMSTDDNRIFQAGYWNGVVYVKGVPNTLRIRSGASLDAQEVTTAALNEQLTIVGGAPVSADGYSWWLVKKAGWQPVIDGFSAGEYLHYRKEDGSFVSVNTFNNGQFIGQLTQFGTKYWEQEGDGYQQILRRFYNTGSRYTSYRSIRFFTYGQPPSSEVSLTGVSFSQSALHPDDRVTATVQASSSSSRSALLGMSIVPAGTTSDYIDDPTNDKIVLVGANSTLTRSFVVPPGTRDGTYDAIVALWEDVDRNGKINSGDTLLASKTSSRAFTIAQRVAQLVVTVNPTQLTLNPGAEGAFTVTVRTSSGTAVSGATIRGYNGMLGGDIVLSQTTDATGRSVYRTTAPQGTEGTFSVSFVATKSGFADSNAASGQIQVNPPAFDVQLSDIRSDQTTVNPGNSFWVAARLGSNRATSVLMRATLVADNNSSVRIEDIAGDRLVSLSVGDNTIGRGFLVPAGTTPGSYTIVLSIYADSNGDGQISSGDPLLVSSTALGAVTVNSTNPQPSNPGVLVFSAPSYNASEGQTDASVFILRNDGSTGRVGATLQLLPSSAGSADFIGGQVSVVFAHGETRKEVRIPIIDDSKVEGEESFSLQLQNPTGGVQLGTPVSATVALEDNDGAAGNVQLDAGVGLAPSRIVGWRVFNQSGVGQTLGITVPRGSSRSVFFAPANAGNEATSLLIKGSAGIRGQFDVRYFLGREDITTRVVNGTFRLDGVRARTYVPIRMQVIVRARAPRNRIHEFTLTVSSPQDPSIRDVCKLRARAQ